MLGDKFEHFPSGDCTDSDWRVWFLYRLGVVRGVSHCVIFARIRGPLFSKHLFDNFYPFSQLVGAYATGRELVAVGFILFVHPSGSEAKFESSVTNVVKGRSHFGEEGWVAIGITEHQTAETDLCGGTGEAG